MQAEHVRRVGGRNADQAFVLTGHTRDADWMQMRVEPSAEWVLNIIEARNGSQRTLPLL